MYGRRAFSYAGPSAWNSLPEHLRAPDLTLNSFRHSLKDIFVHTDDTSSALETFSDSGLYKFTFYIYITTTTTILKLLLLIFICPVSFPEVTPRQTRSSKWEPFHAAGLGFYTLLPKSQNSEEISVATHLLKHNVFRR